MMSQQPAITGPVLNPKGNKLPEDEKIVCAIRDLLLIWRVPNFFHEKDDYYGR